MNSDTARRILHKRARSSLCRTLDLGAGQGRQINEGSCDFGAGLSKGRSVIAGAKNDNGIRVMGILRSEISKTGWSGGWVGGF